MYIHIYIHIYTNIYICMTIDEHKHMDYRLLAFGYWLLAFLLAISYELVASN